MYKIKQNNGALLIKIYSCILKKNDYLWYSDLALIFRYNDMTTFTQELTKNTWLPMKCMLLVEDTTLIDLSHVYC